MGNSGIVSFPKGQDEQLELYLGHLSHHVLARETQVDTRGVDVPVAELLLEGIESAAAVQEVDRVAVAEEMSVDVPLEPGSTGRSTDDLIGPLLGDMPATP